jgi:hypothetical protein
MTIRVEAKFIRKYFTVLLKRLSLLRISEKSLDESKGIITNRTAYVNAFMEH